MELSGTKILVFLSNRCFEQGKGNVIRQAFMEIDAKTYCMIDGDNTYGIESFTEMYEMIVNGRADMVTGDRLSTSYFTENKRRFHKFWKQTFMKSSINKMFKLRIIRIFFPASECFHTDL